MKNGSKRRAWTSEQVRGLKTMARKKTPAPQTAKRLKRTEGATRQKAFSLGLSLELAMIVSSKTHWQLCPSATPPTQPPRTMMITCVFEQHNRCVSTRAVKRQ